MRTFQRSKPLQIYMKPGIKEDDLLLKVWESCAEHDRPQDVFRTMLRRGLMAMVESGDMPEIIIEDCSLDSYVAKRRRRGQRASVAEQPLPQHYPAPYPTAPHPGYAPAPYQAPVQPVLQERPRETYIPEETKPETTRRPEPTVTQKPEDVRDETEDESRDAKGDTVVENSSDNTKSLSDAKTTSPTSTGKRRLGNLM